MTQEPQDPPSRWPIVIDERIAPVFAFAFWGIICLLIVFATAEGKNSPMTAFFASAGAAGQVFFAYGVLKLGKQQFDFVKKAADRQARIDTYAHRSAFFVEWQTAIRTRGALRHPNDDMFASLHKINDKAFLLFDDDISAAINEVVVSYTNLLTESDQVADLVQHEATEAAITAARLSQKIVRKTTQSLILVAHRKLVNTIRLHS